MESLRSKNIPEYHKKTAWSADPRKTGFSLLDPCIIIWSFQKWGYPFIAGGYRAKSHLELDDN